MLDQVENQNIGFLMTRLICSFASCIYEEKKIPMTAAANQYVLSMACIYVSKTDRFFQLQIVADWTQFAIKTLFVATLHIHAAIQNGKR